MRKSALLFASWIACAATATAELPSSPPEAEGLSSERLSRVDALAGRYIESGTFPGAIAAVARNGKVVHLSALGRRGTEDERPLPLDALFRMYSSTKMVTAVAVMQQYEQGRFQLSDPVANILPELASLEVLRPDGESEPARTQITMHELLTHTSGLSYGIDANDPVDRAYLEAQLWVSEDLDTLAAKVGRLPLRSHPGTEWRYSVGMDLAGLVVQRLAGQRFDRYLQEHLFEPLDMRDTGFVVPDGKRDRFLPNHLLGQGTAATRAIDPTREAVEFPGGLFGYGCGSGCDYRSVTLFSGGAGLVSTARDYLRFGEMLRNGGALGGVRILSPTTVDFMASAHVPPEIMSAGAPHRAVAGQSFGLGVGVLTDPVARGVSGNAGEFYHDGAAGTVFWVDPVEDIVGLGMIQVMGGFVWGPALKTAVYQAVTESKR